LAGVDVTAVDANEDHVRAIRDKGLRVYGPLGEKLARLKVCLPNEIRDPYECVILSVKSDQTESASRQIARFLPRAGFVVSFQNGLNELVIADQVGRERTVGAFVNWSAEYMEPGTLWLGGLGALVLGELDGRVTPRLEELLPICRIFNPEAEISADVMGYLWGKLIYGSFLRVTALADQPIVAGLMDSQCQESCIRLAREIIEIADRHGIALHGFNGFDPEAFRTGAAADALARTFRDMTAFNATSEITHASVWRDLTVRRRKTDTRWQYSPFVELASRYGMPARNVEALIGVFDRIEAGAVSVGKPALEQFLAS
jgi:2-dehydropantoate 2-reductase